MTVCAIGTTTPQIEIEYTTQTNCTNVLKRYQFAPEHITGYPLYNEQDGDETGFYVITPHEAYNLVPNPSFGTSQTGWSSFNAYAIRTNDFSFDSGFSLRLAGSGDFVTTERREYAEIEIDGWSAGITYVASAYLWLPQLWDNQDPIMGTISIVDYNGTTYEEVFSTQVSKLQTWERVGVSKNIRDDTTNVYLRVNLRSQNQRELTQPYDETGYYNLQNEFIYADLFQFEQGTEATTPFHGATDTLGTAQGGSCKSPFKWLGAEHESASYRAGWTKISGKLTSLTSLGLEMLNHSGHDAPQITQLAEKYANKTGSYYQGNAIAERTLTFTGFNCACSLSELECNTFQIANGMLPTLDDCGTDKFLLIYHHDDCSNHCDNDRDLAILVSYAGGFEYTRDSRHRQNMVIQLTAHDPVSWFSWPATYSHPLDMFTPTLGNRVLGFGATGEIETFDIEAGTDINAVACLAGTKNIVYGGASGLVNDDCAEACQTVFLEQGGNVAVNDLETALSGEVLIAGNFNSPISYIGRLSANGQTLMGYAGGYTGGEAYAIHQPSWAQVVVGSATGVHILDVDGNWTTYATDGAVLDIISDLAGNLYIVGEFTQIDGVAAGYAAKFNINVDNCFSLDGATWESLGYTFNASMSSLAVDPNTNIVYLGGDATSATPDPVNDCSTTDSATQQSNGNNQELQIITLGGGLYDITFRTTNHMFIVVLDFCINRTEDGRYFRITASNGIGTSYTITAGQHNLISWIDGGIVGGQFIGTIRLDTNIALPSPCAELNQAFSDEIDFTNQFVQIWAAANLSGNGAGYDDAISKFSVQCVLLNESYQGDDVNFNYVVAYDGSTLSTLGDGLPQPVNALAFNSHTGELVAGTDAPTQGDGLYYWAGLDWVQFYGQIHGETPSAILDLHFCKSSCTLYLVSDGDGLTLTAGRTEVFYNGNFETIDGKITIQGNGTLTYLSQHVEGCTPKQANLCSTVPCGSTASVNFANNTIEVSEQMFNNSLLQGSRLDYWLNNDRPMYFGLYLTEQDPTSKAVLTWRDHFWGINAICCNNRINGKYLPNGGIGQTELPLCDTSCNETVLNVRPPENGDCGYMVGTEWIDLSQDCGVGLYININPETCETDNVCETESIMSDGGGGTYLIDGEDGEIICFEGGE